MNPIFLLAMMAMTASSGLAESVSGHYRSNGTYVENYQRSDRNDTVRDNYEYKGNTNPYIGSTGSNYYRNNSTSEYYNGGVRRSTNSFGSQRSSSTGHGGWGN